MNIANNIDHTMLKADAGKNKILSYCEEAKENGFASVCVNTCYVKLVASELKESEVKTCCVVGFPLGAMSTEAKAYEAKKAVEDGADEVDMVINIGAVKDLDWDYVRTDIEAVVKASKPAIVKVIIETCLLTDEEKKAMCKAVTAAGADYIKTSTGFSAGGATREDVALFKAHVASHVKIKAAGGISSLQDAEDFMALGADRLGTSRIVKLVKGEHAEGY